MIRAITSAVRPIGCRLFCTPLQMILELERGGAEEAGAPPERRLRRAKCHGQRARAMDELLAGAYGLEEAVGRPKVRRSCTATLLALLGCEQSHTCIHDGIQPAWTREERG